VERQRGAAARSAGAAATDRRRAACGPAACSRAGASADAGARTGGDRADGAAFGGTGHRADACHAGAGECRRQRAGLPPLAFGGSIYSDTPANRLLIVNGQLLHGGDALGPGARLEQIKPKAAVISIRGQRFEIGL